MATIREVAKLAGVSETTVSLALSGNKRITEETRLKVLSAANQLGYTPNSLARGLRLSKSGIIGLIVSDVRNPFYSKIIMGIEEALGSDTYTLFLSNHLWDSSTEAKLIEKCIRNRVEGVLIAPAEGRFDHFSLLDKADIPYVFIDRIPKGWPEDLQVDAVLNDNFEGALLATEHLISLGHRRIAHITGEREREYVSSFRDLIAGYRHAHLKHGLDIRDDYIEYGGLTIEKGREAMERLLGLETPPTAVFCVNDMAALGAIAAIKERGLVVGKDVAVVGVDDIEVGVLPDIRLTTISQPEYEMGSLAANILLERIKQPVEERRNTPRRKQIMGCRLIVRGSCGASST